MLYEVITLKARAVLRDTGRILQMSYGQVDRLCKMVPNHPTDPWTLPRALNGVAELKREYDNDDEVHRLIDLAVQLEGLPRNSSTHAAGVVIGDRPLAELIPLYVITSYSIHYTKLYESDGRGVGFIDHRIVKGGI